MEHLIQTTCNGQYCHVEKDVISLFQHVRNLYNKCMEHYTKRTGGGAGHPEKFHNWKNSDSKWIAYYLNDQECNLFLAVIHMSDKEFNFPMVKIMGSMPTKSQIDDCFDVAAAANNDEEGGNITTATGNR